MQSDQITNKYPKCYFKFLIEKVGMKSFLHFMDGVSFKNYISKINLLISIIKLLLLNLKVF